MISRHLRSLVLAGLALGVLAACLPENNVNREVVSLQSPDGIPFTYMFIDEDGVTDVSVDIAWRSDWLADPTRNAAVPHIAKQLLDNARTSELSQQDLARAFSDWNANLFFQMRPDHMVLELGFPIEHADPVLEITSAVLADPVFEPEWTARMTTNLRDTIARAQQQPGVAMWEAARRAMLDDATGVYRFLTLPDLDEISAVSPAAVMRFHTQTVTNRPEAVVVSGPITRKAAGAAVDQLLSNLAARPDVPALRQPMNLDARMIYLHLPDAPSTGLGFVGALPQSRDGLDYVDRIATRMLSEGTEAPLFLAVRQELRATYGISSGLANYDRANRLFFLNGEVAPEHLADAVSVIREVYDTFRRDPGAERLARFQELQAQRQESSIVYVDIGARGMREQILDGLPAQDAFAQAEKSRALTVEALVARLQGAFPAADALIVVAAGPDPADLPGACVITAVEQARDC